jgi:hypothetical protein
MPTTYRIDCELRLVLGRVDGRLTDNDLLQYQDSLRTDPRFRPDFDQVLDLRSCERVEVSRAAVCSAALRSPFGTTSRRAVLAADLSTVELGRVFGLWSDGLAGRTRIFDTADGAMIWLGIPGFDMAENGAPWYPVIRSNVGAPRH